MRKNNITLSLENIISFSINITSHFTGRAKIITLILVIIMLSFVNIINTSALSYQSSVGVGFTFNPTLSVSLSSSDLVIANLVPGNTLDSNVINVSVASNASYGYTLSAMMNGNNSNLTHTNGTNTFSSIATNADLSDLEDSEDSNIWGCSYKDNTVGTPTWSNYNGLSSSVSATLLDTNTNNTETGIDSIDFKIAAKAASTQASGTYAGTINFTAITKHIPVTLAEAYASEGKTMTNGFYTMQDMTSTICNKVEAIGAQLQVLDKRDNKLYWISKLADNNCWMTQNLDLDLDSNRTYTHWDTDLGWTVLDNNVEWKPKNSTRKIGWNSSRIEPSSLDVEAQISYTSNSDVDDTHYNSLQECVVAEHSSCEHYYIGNYYNWPAAIADNNVSNSSSALNSICPSSWRLPTVQDLFSDFANLLYLQDITIGQNGGSYANDGFNKIRHTPVFLVRSGYIGGSGTIREDGIMAHYWTGVLARDGFSYHLSFGVNNVISANAGYGNDAGFSVRCLAR